MGMIIFPILLLYVFVSYVIYKIILIGTEKKFLSIIIFILILLLPFWDLMLQKSVKTFYEIFSLLEPKVYSYPEKDKDGKIESLGLCDVTNILKTNLDEEKIYIHYSKFVKNFVELSVYDPKSFNKKKKIILLLNNNTYKYIDKEEARYVFNVLPKEKKFFGLYKIYKVEMIDVKTKKILGKSTSISFGNDLAYIREKLLLMVTGNGASLFYVDSIGGYGGFVDLEKKLRIEN